jgi:toxin ParE1/3/4
VAPVVGQEARAEGASRVTVVWSPRAIGHLVDLRAYIARENPGAAARAAATVLAAVDRLALLPNLGRPGRVSGTRELVIPGTPYVVPYRLRGERLEMIAVFHGRQAWPKRL